MEQENDSSMNDAEYFEYLHTQEAFDKWLYENYTINNGDKLIQLYEDGETQLKYLSDIGLPENSEIKGL